tara:strand:- start:23 stop:349 length:327 start_codon:yes stop_codon:yes gene_type:complete
MEIGKLVWNNYHGILRFGTIKSKRIDQSGWAFYKVKWHDDRVYENALRHRENLTNKKHNLEEYRSDQIKMASKNNLSKVVQEHENTIRPATQLTNKGLCAPSPRLDVV